MRYIDADELLETLANDYDLEDTPEYRALVKEIELAPTIARTWREWWEMRMRVQGYSIDHRFKDRPILKEEYKSRLEFYAGVLVFFAVISVMAIFYTIGAWFV